MMISLEKTRITKFGRILILLVLLLSGCKFMSSDNNELILSRYEDFILNAAVNCADCDLDFFLSKHPQEFGWVKNQIILPRKTIYDEALSLKMAFHSWANSGGDHPKTILYLSDNDGFEYAFPFLDEYQIKKSRSLQGNINQRSWSEDNTSFQTHINYLLQRLDKHGMSDVDFANKLITMTCDSLLSMRELDTNDTTAFRKEIQNLLKDGYPFEEDCSNIVQKNINSMVFSAAKRNVRYFQTRAGDYAFWEIKIVDVKTRKRVEAKIVNIECFKIISI